MHQSSLTCFGVGDGFPCADRNHASFLYRLRNSSVLIDCGESVDSCYQSSGLSYDVFDSILISHLHADHIAGLFMLIQGCWLEGRRKPLKIYLPGSAIPAVRAMLAASFLFQELFKFRLDLLPLKPGRAMAVRDLRITPFQTTHLDRARGQFQKKYGNIFESFSFLLERGRLRVGHSADLGRPEDLDPLFSEPLDLLVCEMAHFSPEEILSYLALQSVRRVVFVHLARPYWAKLPQLRRLAAKRMPHIPHTFARDGAVIPF
jgi:ribonuclease Z